MTDKQRHDMSDQNDPVGNVLEAALGAFTSSYVIDREYAEKAIAIHEQERAVIEAVKNNPRYVHHEVLIELGKYQAMTTGKK